MASEDWTREELEAAVDAFVAMRADGGAVSTTCEALVAGTLSGRNFNSVRRRLTHVGLVLDALAAGGSVDEVIGSTNIGRGVAEAIAEILGARADEQGQPSAPPAFGGNWSFINTDAASLGGVSPHEAWLEHRMAFTGGPRTCGEWLGQFAVGDTLFMWANGLGVVAVGRVLGAWDGVGHQDALVYRAPHADTEYRLAVDWLVDLREKPLGQPVLGFNPVRAVERIQGVRRARLDAVLRARFDPRTVWWHPRVLPDTAAFVEALGRVKVSDLQRRLLSAQYAEPERAVTGARLAAAAGVAEVGVVNLHYGGLGRVLGEELGLPAFRWWDGGTAWWTVLSWCPQREPFVWQMQPPLAEALERLGWVDVMASAAPDEVPGGSATYFEGAVRQVTVNAYERDPLARRACIEHHGAVCVVCDFDFGKVYGDIGEGFIHVHHLRPVSTLGAGYAVDPVSDLAPVCPNCHAMMHRRSPPMSPEALRLRLRP